MLLGAHMSVSGGVDTAFERAIAINCTALQIFTKSNRQWQAKDLEAEVIDRFCQRQQDCGLPVVCHASYLLNLATPDDAVWHKSIEALVIELQRCEQLHIPSLVLHCGGHMGSGIEAGLARVAAGLDLAHQRLPGYRVKTALEISAGQGTHLGVTFAEIAEMIRLCHEPDRLAVCFDTCHALAAGYEFRTPESYAAMIAEFERIIGLDRLTVFHLNDSEKDLGSRVDRHTHIGEGFIGLEPFGYFLNDPRFQHIPFLLETPVDDDPADNIRNLDKLRSLVKRDA